MSQEQDIDFMKRKCEEMSVDWGVTWIVYDEWYPLLKHAHDTIGEEFDKEFVLNWELHQLKERNGARLLMILDKLKAITSNFTRAERSAISLHTEHFALAEGLLNAQLGFLIWTLINNGHEFKFKGDLIDTYEKISDRTLGQKLHFIKATGTFPVVTAFVDAVSRNHVGHLSYEIKPSGEILFDGDAIDYEGVYKKMRHVNGALGIVTNCYYTRYNLEHLWKVYSERMKRATAEN